MYTEWPSPKRPRALMSIGLCLSFNCKAQCLSLDGHRHECVREFLVCSTCIGVHGNLYFRIRVLLVQSTTIPGCLQVPCRIYDDWQSGPTESEFQRDPGLCAVQTFHGIPKHCCCPLFPSFLGDSSYILWIPTTFHLISVGSLLWLIGVFLITICHSLCELSPL